MKKSILILLAALVPFGCHKASGQMPPGPTVYTCSTPVYASGQTPNYTVLNPAGTSSTSYTDTPGAGTWCYVAQSFNSTTGQNSPPSNVVQVTVTAGTGASLSMTGGSGPLFLISRIAATAASPLTAPALTSSAATASVKGKIDAPTLMASVR